MESNENKIDVTELWRRYKINKSVPLRNKLAEIYLPLVKIVCGRLAVSLPPHLDRDDLLSSGFFGLLETARRNRQIRYRSQRKI